MFAIYYLFSALLGLILLVGFGALFFGQLLHWHLDDKRIKRDGGIPPRRPW